MLAGLLHWFTAPYVHRLVYDRRTGSVEAETINILGQRHISRFHVAEAAYPDTIRPQVTFEASLSSAQLVKLVS